jgi:hypothetical protein
MEHSASTYISYNSQRIAEAVGDWFFERGNVTAHTLATTLAIILCSGETIKTNYSLPACRPRFGWMVKGTFTRAGIESKQGTDI